MIVTGQIGPPHPGKLVHEPRDWRVGRMTHPELLRFVADVVAGKILLAQHVENFDENIGCVFPKLEFLHWLTPEARREIGTVYEYLDQATGTARNGQPSFNTVRFIHVEDWLLARDLIAAEMIRKEMH